MQENTFVIRMWCEPSEHESVKPQLRGVIEHVTTGQRQYIAHTAGIGQFIQTYIPSTSPNSNDNTRSISQWIDQENQ